MATTSAHGWPQGALALLVLLAGSACSPRPPADSAVLVTVDTWRADRFGAGGHPSLRTPHLDRFFRRATQFTDAHSPVPTTLASHASLLTGEWPTGHGVPRNGWPLAEEAVTLAEILADEGFETGAFVSSAALHPSFGLAQGFEVYDFDTPRTEARDQDWRGAEATLRRAEAWWAEATGRRLLWVHLFEPHFPYDPDPLDFALYDTGYRGPADGSMDFLFAVWEDASRLPPPARAHLEALYHAEITGLDRKMGRFLERMAKESGVLTVVVADHGESLEDHGLRFKHGPLVHPPDVQVPLAVGGCAPFGAGLSGAVVRTVDVFATVLDRLGVSANASSAARSLAGEEAEGTVAFAEASMPWSVEERGVYPNYHKQRVIRTGEWAYVETPYLNEQAWYHRASDPDETRPVAGPDEAERRRLDARLQEWIDRGRDRPAPSTVDPTLVDRLRSLGYIE